MIVHEIRRTVTEGDNVTFIGIAPAPVFTVPSVGLQVSNHAAQTAFQHFHIGFAPGRLPHFNELAQNNNILLTAEDRFALSGAGKTQDDIVPVAIEC